MLTASRATEYSFEGDQVSGEGLPSVFTRAVVDGLKSGEADRDRDGLITVSDLYQHVYEAVREAEPRQTPELWTYGAEGDLLVARSVRGAAEEPPPLPGDLQITLESPRAGVRASAVAELARLLDTAGPGMASTARQVLHQVAEQDVPAVAAVARAALRAAPGEAAGAVAAAAAGPPVAGTAETVLPAAPAPPAAPPPGAPEEPAAAVPKAGPEPPELAARRPRSGPRGVLAGACWPALRPCWPWPGSWPGPAPCWAGALRPSDGRPVRTGRSACRAGVHPAVRDRRPESTWVTTTGTSTC